MNRNVYDCIKHLKTQEQMLFCEWMGFLDCTVSVTLTQSSLVTDEVMCGVCSFFAPVIFLFPCLISCPGMFYSYQGDHLWKWTN